MKKRLTTIIFLLCLGLTALWAGGTKETADDSVRNVTVLTPYLSSVTTKDMVDSLRTKLQKQGINVTVIDTANDFSALASRIEDTVSAKPDAMILVSADPNLVAAQLQGAFDAGIPVLGCDSGFIDGMLVNATSDNYAMGVLIVRYLFDELMGGKGTVIALTHRPHPGVVKRCIAFDDIIKEYPDITLITEQHVNVPNPIENARQTVENLALANPAKGSVTAIWCAWDEPAIGATQALMDAGRDEVIVTGVDGNSQAIALIEQGTNLKATVAQNFEGMTDLVVQTLDSLFVGEAVQPGELYAPAVLITQE
ncbi:MAG: sugar ABC transporter substrate-binding protein [Sphaerochaetaceae bacterium]